MVPHAPNNKNKKIYTATARTGRASGSTETRLTSELALGQISCSQRKLEAWSDVLLARFQELLQCRKILLVYLLFTETWTWNCYCTLEWDQRVLFRTHTYIYMYIVVDLDVVLCIPHGHSCDEVRFGLCCQFQVPFDMVLNDWKPRILQFSTWVCIHRQLTSYWIQRKFTSLMKSSCFLSSASIARSSMPPGVALSVWQNRSFWFSNSKSLSSDNVQLLPTLLAVHFKKMPLCP